GMSTLILTGQRTAALAFDPAGDCAFRLATTPTSQAPSRTAQSMPVSGDKVAVEDRSVPAAVPCSMKMALTTPMASTATIPARFISLPPPVMASAASDCVPYNAVLCRTEQD